jgi:SNF family Na+-dependent transporter
VYKGVKSSSYIVWVTVPLPIIFIIVMIIKGASLEGAGEGVKQYLRGVPDKIPDLMAQL